MLTHNWRASSKILLNVSACLLLVAKVLALGWVKTSKRRIDSRSGMVAAGLRDITALRIKNGINWKAYLVPRSHTYTYSGHCRWSIRTSKHSRPRCTPWPDSLALPLFARITDHDKGSWSLATYSNIQIVRVTFFCAQGGFKCLIICKVMDRSTVLSWMRRRLRRH